MKKILIMILLLVLSLSLIGCEPGYQHGSLCLEGECQTYDITVVFGGSTTVYEGVSYVSGYGHIRIQIIDGPDIRVGWSNVYIVEHVEP